MLHHTLKQNSHLHTWTCCVNLLLSFQSDDYASLGFGDKYQLVKQVGQTVQVRLVLYF